MTRYLILGVCMLLTGCSPQSGATLANAKTSVNGWVILLDENSMGDWQQVGQSNWRMEQDGAVADARTGSKPGYLVSRKTYKDFVLHVEFWASNDANSGVFFRCADPGNISDASCYEANIYDERPDPSYGTGAIVLHSEVSPMPKASGKWNTYIITAKGRDITLVLNGETTAILRSGLLEEGHLALQHGAGVIKFRKVLINPL